MNRFYEGLCSFIYRPKRAMFTQIQASASTFCSGAQPLPVRTGYELVIGHRTDDLFAMTARDDGMVESISDKVVTILYKDGSKDMHEIGMRFGKWGGHTIPQPVASDLKQGQKVKKGDVISYNTNYFQRNYLDPKRIIYKGGVLARMIFWESEDTDEDSSALTSRFTPKLGTDDTYIRSVKVRFDQEIRNPLQNGEKVSSESILCTLHAATAGNADLYDDKALDTLSHISKDSPKAKKPGLITKVEVLYAGELEDMSESLRDMAEKSDQSIRQLNKQLGQRAVDGRVDVGHRIDGQPLDLDEAVVRYYINTSLGMRGGDKVVYAHQMKSVVNRIIDDVLETEDGVAADGVFSYVALQNRIVKSAELIGTTATLLIAAGELFVNAYYK